jgi:hypothetical protein
MVSPGQVAFDFRAARHDAASSGHDSYLSSAKHIQSIPSYFRGFFGFSVVHGCRFASGLPLVA